MYSTYLEMSVMGIRTPVSLFAIITVMRHVSGLIRLMISLAVMDPVSLDTGRKSTSVNSEILIHRTRTDFPLLTC